MACGTCAVRGVAEAGYARHGLEGMSLEVAPGRPVAAGLSPNPAAIIEVCRCRWNAPTRVAQDTCMNKLIVIASMLVGCIRVGTPGRLLTSARRLLAAGAAAIHCKRADCATQWHFNDRIPFGPGANGIVFRLDSAALWLALFGSFRLWSHVSLAHARNARGWIAGGNGLDRRARCVWCTGCCLVLIAWELMSIGGACMLRATLRSRGGRRPS